MHNDQIERAIEGVFSGYEQDQTLTGEQTLNLVLATLSALIRALGKRSASGKNSGATTTVVSGCDIITLGLERALLHNLSAIQQNILQFQHEEVEE